ncbi:MAG: hypothetical protein LBP35_04600, partial [Candidatus Ancillula trichonymphae]|nr:hypothetical protein [Candidatus Ancillula trichonymphae]
LMLSGLGLTMRKKLNSTKLNSAEMRTAKFLRNIIVARRCAVKMSATHAVSCARCAQWRFTL